MSPRQLLAIRTTGPPERLAGGKTGKAGRSGHAAARKIATACAKAVSRLKLPAKRPGCSPAEERRRTGRAPNHRPGFGADQISDFNRSIPVACRAIRAASALPFAALVKTTIARPFRASPTPSVLKIP